MVKYLGSKRKLITSIQEVMEPCAQEVASACDLFSGTTRVSQMMKRVFHPATVIANDYSSYGYHLARTFVEANSATIDREILQKDIDHLNRLPGKPGWFTETYSEHSRFFQAKNASRMEAIRDEIDNLWPEVNGERPVEHSILLTSLLLAADKVDSTCGVQMAYLKEWATRSFKDLVLEIPKMTPGFGVATQRDATDLEYLEAVNYTCDLVYLDAPYNQHSYLSNYHIWETLCLNDRPDVYGVACKRIDCQDRKSPFNQKNNAAPALAEIVKQLPDVDYLLLSFSNEGYVSESDMLDLLSDTKREVTLSEIDHARYIGHAIGGHNSEGDRVSPPTHSRNTEYLYLAKRQGSESTRVA